MSEPPRHALSPAGQQVGKRVPPSTVEIAANEDLYAIAYDEAKRTVDDQGVELNNIRQRAVQYIAFVGSATAFLVGTGIKGEARHLWFYMIASIATSLSLFAVGLVVLLLSPWFTNRWNKRIAAKRIIGDWVERDVPVPSKALLMRELAIRYDDWRNENELVLTRVRKMYMVAVGIGGVQLILWVVLVWMMA